MRRVSLKAYLFLLLLVGGLFTFSAFIDELRFTANRVQTSITSAEGFGDFYFLLRNPTDRLDVINIEVDEDGLCCPNKLLSLKQIDKKWSSVKATINGSKFEAKLRSKGLESFNVDGSDFSFSLKMKSADFRLDFCSKNSSFKSYGF